jgi:3',5'-cyclic AMP phosphodiesterase CpdA
MHLLLKTTFLLSAFALITHSGCPVMAQTPTVKNHPELKEFNFIIASDLGRNGYYDQKTIAETMGVWADKADVDFIIAAGDIHHFNGVASLTDPLWLTNFEWVYSHPALMIDWYPVLGNHEYRGNTQAVLNYGAISRRWVMPGRYYTLVKQVDDSTSIRFVLVDTPPMIDKYTNDPLIYPDAVKQNYAKQLQFIDSVLTAATEQWVVVIGHHPIYSHTSKSESERTDMQTRLNPILVKHNTDFYVCGHIHNFQHIKMDNNPVNYIVNSSASLARNVEPTMGTQFCGNQSGFTVCSVSHNVFTLYFIDKDGQIVYSYSKTK